MPEELTPGTSTWHDTITSPTNGDAVEQTAWKAGNQDLGDNVGYCKEKIEGSTVGAGIRRIRCVDDETALAALASVVADDVCLVRTRGLYFARTSNVGNPSPFQVASTGTAGIWWEWAGMFGLDEQLEDAIVITGPGAAGKLLRPDVVPNRIVEQLTWGTGTIDTTIGTYQSVTGDTNWHDVTSMAVTFTEDLEEDDVVEIIAKLQVAGDDTGTSCFRAVVTFEAVDHEVTGSGAYGGVQTTIQAINCSGSYPVPVGGASGAVVKIQCKVSGAGIVAAIGDTGLFLQATAVRP